MKSHYLSEELSCDLQTSSSYTTTQALRPGVPWHWCPEYPNPIRQAALLPPECMDASLSPFCFPSERTAPQASWQHILSH
ncbi:hypothetical protein AOLI_G00016230 [Acnodon oligacanthus]